MTTKTEVKLNRLDDDTIEMKTLITQQLTNQEFYDMWAGIGMKISQNKQMLEQGKQQIKQVETKIEVDTVQKEKMAHLAEDCRVRIPSKVPEIPKKEQ